MEDVGIDEAFLDITHVEGAAEEIARDIKRKIAQTTGLSCSIGIASNKLLAKIASDMEKPDGLTILAEGDLEGRIWPLPVRKLWGVGPKTEASLKGLGIETIGSLAAMPAETLAEHFGKSYGSYLHEASRGIDESPLVTHWEPKSSSRETTFQQDIDNWQVIARNLAELVKDVVDDIRQRGYRCRTVTVKLRFSDFKTLTRAKSLPTPADTVEEIRRSAFDCLARFEIKKKVRLLGVRLSGLAKKEQPHGS